MAGSDDTSLSGLLARAANDPAARPAFYQALMDAQVYIIARTGTGADGPVTLQQGEDIEIESWQREDGGDIIPFFSSAEELRKCAADDAPCLRLPAQALFDITLGAFLTLDPEGEYGKEFLPEEIEALLGGYIPGEQPPQNTSERDVLLYQPSDYPRTLADRLAQIFAQDSGIAAAHLSMMLDPGQSEKPQLLIGLIADSQQTFEAATQKAGPATDGLMEPGTTVNFLYLGRDEAEAAAGEGLTAHLARTKPFHKRKKGFGLFKK